MPSVTDTTVPWFLISADAPRPSMWLLMSSEISAGFSCITFSLRQRSGGGPNLGFGPEPSRRQGDFHLFETCFHRGVEHFVARSEERRVGKEGRSRWSPYH